MQQRNPFAVQTPESMSPEEVAALFVPFPAFQEVTERKHTFIHGSRGSGKSMLFRRLRPEIVMLVENIPADELKFISVYLPVKQAHLALPELGRLAKQAGGVLFSEHLLVCLLAVNALETWLTVFKNSLSTKEGTEALEQRIRRHILPRLRATGWRNTDDIPPLADGVAWCEWLKDQIDYIHIESITGYLQRLTWEAGSVRYVGALLGYRTVLLPLLDALLSLPGVPERIPVFVLIDDADNLSMDQTMVLNSWVSQRTTETVCLKVSTQLKYKTYCTLSDDRIESPHDFTEINLNSVLIAGGPNGYEEWLSSILLKRMEIAGLKDVTLDAFFPEEKKQQKGIEAIAQEIKDGKWKGSGRSFRAQDDVYRYARPEYMRRLGGKSKGSHTYSYSGYRQLVHVSSGIIRFFLDPASKMYSEQVKKNRNKPVRAISPDIQTSVLRDTADSLMFQELDKLIQDPAASGWLRHSENLVDALKKLKNLVQSLGAVFRLILIDEEKSERRVFSLLLNDEPNDEVGEIIRLGIMLGYFHEATIGAKDGLGRTRRIVLTRRLAPYFNLDPIGFSGYLSVTQDFLQNALIDHKRIRGRLRDAGVDEVTKEPQLTFNFESTRR